MKEVLLVGNPNTGKTTLFNAVTCSNEHVGNWHGVTVENKSKKFLFEGQEFMLVDTPGLYSLCPLSFEEEVAAKKIFESDAKIINICDQNNLERNLYLTLCLLEKGCDVVLAVNQIDKHPIWKVDSQKLGGMLGIDVIEINAQKKVGIENLKKSLSNPKKQKVLPYLKEISLQIDKNAEFDNNRFKIADEQYLKVKVFEKDDWFYGNLPSTQKQKLFAYAPKDSVQKLAKLRYDFIKKVLSICATKADRVYGKNKFDKFCLNKWFALPIFFLIMAGIFYLTFFSVGAFLSDCLSKLLSACSTPFLNWIESICGQGAVLDFFGSAIFGGLGTVLSFLPQVVLLFFFLAVLEDSGYMARIAFIFEDILGRIGLSGKSIYTLLMGFGCSTTAIMTARNMDDKNAKIKTAMLCPYMSCSAKIPIYTVIGGAFFGNYNIFCIMGLYFLGIVVAVCVSKILDFTILKSEAQSFILEFPPYRMMSFGRVFKVLWKNLKEFVVRIGSIMVAMNIIVWILSRFTFKFSYSPQGSGSILESLGKVLAPIFSPLGFGSWAIVAALLAGLVAKEVVVSAIAMFNGVDAGSSLMIANSIMLPTSLVFFSSKAAVLSFLVFCLLYTPCIASISMLLQEIGRRWTLVSIAIQVVSAYLVSLLVFNVAVAFEKFGFWRVFVIFVVFLLILSAFLLVLKKIRHKKICSHCDGCGKCLK